MNSFINTLRDSTQLLVFSLCIATGLVYLVAAWALGQFGGGHGDGGHEHDHDADHGGDSGHATVSIFSPKIIALFCVGLGAGGALATVYGLGVTSSSLIGLASGLGLGGLMVGMLRMLYSQQASSNLDIDSAIGRIGTVTIDIMPGATGEIALSVSGQYTTFFARARMSELLISRGREVKVVSVSGSTLIVE